MEQWEYAFGVENWRADPTEWTNESEPGTYAAAELALMRAVAADDPMSDYSLHGPCIVRRSIRYPRWQPVVDHAAELLAEVLGEIAKDVNRAHPRDTSPSKTVAFYLARAAKALDPKPETEEYDA